MYMLDPEVGFALETWLKIIRPSITSEEIKALLTAKFRALKLEELPLKKAIFIFDSAMIDTQKAIPMIPVARGGSWIPLYQKRMNMIDNHDFEGWQRLKMLNTYLLELEVTDIERKRDSARAKGEADRPAEVAGRIGTNTDN